MSYSISSMRDLEKYGFSLLTGEACGLGYRILCDVYPRGKKILENLLATEFKLAPSWNHTKQDGSEPVGSIMLPCSMLEPIAIFALLEVCPIVLVPLKDDSDLGKDWNWDGVHGFTQDEIAEGRVEDWLALLSSHGWKARKFHKHGDAQSGYRFQHQMSGRVE